MTPGKSTKSILDMTHEEARKFLLKDESYLNLDLPEYFNFEQKISKISTLIAEKKLSNFSNSGTARSLDDVNYTIIANKDGKYSWRPFQLIHPAIYVSLVHELSSKKNWNFIVKRFLDFQKYKKISCLSLPLEKLDTGKDKSSQILGWWANVEQKSIELALDFNMIIHSDITDCYGSIYTHSLSWALHTKPTAKKNRRSDSLLGNVIDWHMQDMRQGQTNGIPQGSVLMDFIAEILLGYADEELGKKLETYKVKDYKILRYRDDYRIFVNSSKDGDTILKCLSEILIDLGLKLNPSKTLSSSNVISSSVKPDKVVWTGKKQRVGDLQKHILIIYHHSLEYPNSGSLVTALIDYYDKLEKTKLKYKSVPLISIITDIAYRNPKVYPIATAILSRLIDSLGNKRNKQIILNKIIKKFSNIPNTEYVQIWLQRISLPLKLDIVFDSPLCYIASGQKCSLWNNDWIKSPKLKKILNDETTTNKKKISKLPFVITREEIELFKKGYNG